MGEPEHLLLGLLLEKRDRGAQVLADLKVDTKWLQQELLKRGKHGAAPVAGWLGRFLKRLRGGR